MRLASLVTAFAFGVVMASPAVAENVVLKKGTDVHLVFDAPLRSETAKPGDTVRLHVETPVQVDGKTVIAAGTPTTGTVTKVNKRGHYGVNARIQLKISPIRTVDGKRAPVGFHTKGQEVSNRTGEAAGATIGGAAILGPLGLAAGYFIVGKKVHIKPGDKTTVTVDKDMSVHVR